MAKRRHQGDTKTFAELTFQEQSKSISASIMNLEKAIEHHINCSANPQDARTKCLERIERLLTRLDLTPIFRTT